MALSPRSRVLLGSCLAGAALLVLPFSGLAAPTFTDVTVSAGVNYTQHTIPCPVGVTPFCEPGSMSGGAAAGDYDGDGNIDLYVTRLDAPDILFRNKGNAKFRDVTSDAGLAGFNLHSNGAAWGDVDNDGDLDLYVTVLGLAGDVTNNRNYLFINDGAGQFTEEAILRGADVSSSDARAGYSISFGDYDRDGWLDIHVTEWLPIVTFNHITHNRLLRNLGSGSPGHFEDTTEAAGVPMVPIAQTPTCLTGGPCFAFGFATAFTDLDWDGWPDLAVAADFGSSRLFWNNRDGTFSDGTVAANVATDENGMGSTFGDYDGDGDLDWFVTSIHDPAATCDTEPCNWGYTGNRLYRNEGNRTFSDATDLAGVREGYWGWGSVFFDYDNDGDLDLTMTNGVDFINVPFDAAWNADPMRLWENDGTGVMTEVSVAAGVTDTGSGKGLLTFDYDNDGDLDLFVVNTFASPVLYRNDGGNDLDWLRVEVLDHGSNRPSVGAHVIVHQVLGGPTQIREIGTGSHFLGQSESTAHFGLGAGNDPVDVVEIWWPSNRGRSFFDVTRNTTLVVVEPPPPSGGVCGLLGIEPFLLVGLLAVGRRVRGGLTKA